MEVETYVMLAERLGYMDPEEGERLRDQITEVSKMPFVLRNRLGSPPRP